MTDTAIAAVIGSVIAAIPATLLAWGTLRTSRGNAAKADTIIQKADEIHLLANSNLAEVSASLKVANEKIIGLERLVSTLFESKKKVRAENNQPT